MKSLIPMSVLAIAVFAAPSFAQQSSRDDYQEFCKAIEGRWIGDVTWVADWPGLGKKGGKVTAYFEAGYAADGNVLIGTFYGGEGSSKWFITYDAAAKQITSLWVTSGGTVERDVIYKKDGKWTLRTTGSNADGTKTEGTSTLTITNDGDTHTWTGSGTVGGKKRDDQHDVWRRVHK